MPLTPAERAAQRRRRRLVAFVTLPGIAIGTAGIGTAYAEGWMHPEPKIVCTGKVVKAPAHSTFTVDVLNASPTAGAAGAAAKLVGKHGFRVGTVGNDEALRTIYGSGEVRYHPSSLDAALFVRQTLLPDARLVETDEVARKTVALVLGKDFTALLPLPPRPPAQAGRTVVNVYNTTYYEGLGKKVSAELTRRGFRAGKVGADPLNSWQRGSALIRYGENGDLNAKLVQQHVPGATLEMDKRTDTSVDVVIGMQLTDLSKLTPLDQVPAPKKWVPPAWPLVTRPCD